MGGHTYAYNGLGQRLSQTVGSTVTQYLIDQQPGLWQVLTSTTDKTTERYVHGPRGIHAQQDATSNWEHMLPDGLGSVRGVTDTTSQMLWSTQYEPYGAAFGTSGATQTMFGFTGEPTDGNDLVHLRARLLQSTGGGVYRIGYF